MIGRYTGPATGARAYHHTAPVSMIQSLHAGLGALLDEGLDAAIARHAECGRLLQDGLAALGCELFAAEGHRLPELTTVWVPGGRRRREGPGHAARPLRHRDRRRARRVRRQGVADRVHGPHGPAPQRDAAAGRAGGGDRDTMTVLTGRRVMLRPLVATDFAAWQEVRRRNDDWLTPWEPARNPGPARRGRAGEAFAMRCSARERERQLGTGFGFGIFVPRSRVLGGLTGSAARSTCPRCSGGRSSRPTSATGSTRARRATATCPRRSCSWPASPSRSWTCTGCRSRSSPATSAAAGWSRSSKLRDEGVAQRYLEINGVWEDHIRYAITVEEWQRPAGRADAGVAGMSSDAGTRPAALAAVVLAQRWGGARVTTATTTAEDTAESGGGGADVTTTTINAGGIEVSAPTAGSRSRCRTSASAWPCRRAGRRRCCRRRAWPRCPARRPAVPGFTDLAHAAAAQGGVIYAAGQDRPAASATWSCGRVAGDRRDRRRDAQVRRRAGRGQRRHRPDTGDGGRRRRVADRAGPLHGGRRRDGIDGRTAEARRSWWPAPATSCGTSR